MREYVAPGPSRYIANTMLAPKAQGVKFQLRGFVNNQSEIINGRVSMGGGKLLGSLRALGNTEVEKWPSLPQVFPSWLSNTKCPANIHK